MATLRNFHQKLSYHRGDMKRNYDPFANDPSGSNWAHDHLCWLNVDIERLESIDLPWTPALNCYADHFLRRKFGKSWEEIKESGVRQEGFYLSIYELWQPRAESISSPLAPTPRATRNSTGPSRADVNFPRSTCRGPPSISDNDDVPASSPPAIKQTATDSPPRTPRNRFALPRDRSAHPTNQLESRGALLSSPLTVVPLEKQDNGKSPFFYNASDQFPSNQSGDILNRRPEFIRSGFEYPVPGDTQQKQGSSPSSSSSLPLSPSLAQNQKPTARSIPQSRSPSDNPNPFQESNAFISPQGSSSTESDETYNFASEPQSTPDDTPALWKFDKPEMLVQMTAIQLFYELQALFRESNDPMMKSLKLDSSVEVRQVIIDGATLNTSPDLYWRVGGTGNYRDILCEVMHATICPLVSVEHA
ncbi:MAG: hypothetical protein M1822_007781 [Bathelium mastoideum]|nr:MAG: hypothetical protein M1822_007781 [Bathelium mastoideum]